MGATASVDNSMMEGIYSVTKIHKLIDLTIIIIDMQRALDASDVDTPRGKAISKNILILIITILLLSL